MKTKWAVLGGFAAVALAVAVGCDTSGGSSSNDGPGSTNKPVVVRINFGVPVCSTVGSGSLNGAVFNASAGFIFVAPACTAPAARMVVPLQVLTSARPSEVDHYIWTIRNWTGATPDGIFTADSYDAVIDTNGVFKVRTSSNQIRYSSALNADLLALTALYKQMIDVIAVTRDGQMASGYISLNLHNGMITGGATVFGSLQSADNLSHARPGSSADYYRITGDDAVNVLDLEGDFDTFLVLYDANLNGVATNDDIIPGFNLNSRITNFLSNGATYYVEATSLSNRTAGSYSLSAGTGKLSPVPNPFVSEGTCDNLARTYTANQTLIVNLNFNGQSSAFTNVSSTPLTISQEGCDFMYPLVDPTGLIPPTLLMGRARFTGLELYSEALIPESSEIIISSSTASGTGTSFATGLSMESAGSVSGTFLGAPFTATYNSVALFGR